MSGNPFEQGSPSPWEAPGAQAEGPPPTPDQPGIPWENEQTAQTMFDTVKGALLDPSRLFAQARPDAGIGPSVLYALVLGFLGGAVGVLWSYLTQAVLGAQDLPENLRFLSMFTQPGLGQLVMIPIASLIGLFVWSLVAHAMLAMFSAADGGFEATVRSIAFANGSVAVLQLVPFVGGMVAGIWGMIIQIMALKEMHHTTHGKTAAAVLLPLGLCCCGGLALAVVAGAGALATFTGK